MPGRGARHDRQGITRRRGTRQRGFETVIDVFAENFIRRGELGGACCAYSRGEKVVDIWGAFATR